MDTFPDEILLKIFQSVPPEDRRKNIQLVCQRWHRICSDTSLSSSKLIVVSRVHSLSYLTPFLKRAPEPLEILFVQLPISVDESEFWTSCGPKIKSLYFRDCSINFSDFQAIFTLCPGLSNFSMTFVTESALDRFFEGYRPNEHARALLSDVPSITSFRVRWNCTFVKGGWFPRNILTKFPNLAVAELSSVPYDEPTEAILLKMDSEENCMPTVDDTRGFIQPLQNLKQLIVSWHDFGEEHPRHVDVFRCLLHEVGYLMVAHTIVNVPRCPAEPLFRLQAKELEKLSVSQLELRPESYRLISTVLHNLTNLTCLSVPFIDMQFGDEPFIPFALSILTNLRVLKLNDVPEFAIDLDAIARLLDSGLKMLQISLKMQSRIHFGLKSLANALKKESDILPSFLPNKTLEALALSGNDGDDKLAFIFTLLFRNLRYIFLSSPSDAVLQNIFKYQKNVVSLTLDDCSKCTDFSFTGVPRPNAVDENEENSYSIKDLTELQCLQLSSLQLKYVTEKTFSQFVLPKLKCLKVVFSSQMDQPNDASKQKKRSHELFQWMKQKKGAESTSSKSVANNPEISAFKAFMESLNNFPLLEILHIQFFAEVPQNIWRPAILKLKRMRYLTIHGVTCLNEADSRDICSEVFQKCPSLCAFVENDKQYYRNNLTGEIEKEMRAEHPAVLSTVMEEICLKWPYSFQPTVGRNYNYF